MATVLITEAAGRMFFGTVDTGSGAASREAFTLEDLARTEVLGADVTWAVEKPEGYELLVEHHAFRYAPRHRGDAHPSH